MMRYRIKSGINGHFREQGFALLSGHLTVQKLRLAQRLTDSTERKLLSITSLFWTSAEKLFLIHPSAALLAKHMLSQEHLVHHHAVSARVPPFSVDSVQPTPNTLPIPFHSIHFDFSPLKRALPKRTLIPQASHVLDS